MPAKIRDAFRLREFLYPANLLTLARLLMLPAAIRYMRQPDGRWLISHQMWDDPPNQQR